MLFKRVLAIFPVLAVALPGTIVYAHGASRDAIAFFFLKDAAIEPSQVIQKVENKEKGKAISFRIKEKEDDSNIRFEIKLLKDGQVLEAMVDPNMGKILKTESEGFFSHFENDEKRLPTAARLDLKNAISNVEKQYGAKAIEAAFQSHSGFYLIRIKLVNSDGAFTVIMDAKTGELFRMAAQDRHRHEEDDDD